METQGQARLLASNKVVDRVKEDLIKTWPRSALLGCAADGFNEGVLYERRKAIEAFRVMGERTRFDIPTDVLIKAREIFIEELNK